VRKGRRIGFVLVADIDWIEARGNACRVHARGEVHLVQSMLGTLEASLDPDVFTRIHRSTIVNWSRVVELRPLAANDYTVLLRDGTRLRLSRFYRERIRDTFLAGM
jgi:two-component system LytT family response regulator